MAAVLKQQIDQRVDAFIFQGNGFNHGGRHSSAG